MCIFIANDMFNKLLEVKPSWEEKIWERCMNCCWHQRQRLIPMLIFLYTRYISCLVKHSFCVSYLTFASKTTSTYLFYGKHNCWVDLRDIKTCTNLTIRIPKSCFECSYQTNRNVFCIITTIYETLTSSFTSRGVLRLIWMGCWWMYPFYYL